jgi:hypothetical protein
MSVNRDAFLHLCSQTRNIYFPLCVFRLALENQRIQSRDPQEKKKLSEEINDLEEKVRIVETDLAPMIEEHRTLSNTVTAYFQQHGFHGRNMSMLSVESLMLTGI